ncbi:MAG: methionine adenosyltransferase domain-containing protein, partial [Bacteroidota bacterium]|nr:methionine adenosyltransferase domain-containing protein [Bacteroidota bacterium]
IAQKITKLIDLRPAAIEKRLKLRAPIYSETAAYGHMGRKNQTVEKVFYRPNGEKKLLNVELFTWEKINLVPAVKNAFNL